MAEAAASPPPVSHNGCPVAPWTDTSKEFLVLQKFPHLRRRLEDGLHCLSRSERARLELVCRGLDLSGHTFAIADGPCLVLGILYELLYNVSKYPAS